MVTVGASRAIECQNELHEKPQFTITTVFRVQRLSHEDSIQMLSFSDNMALMSLSLSLSAVGSTELPDQASCEIKEALMTTVHNKKAYRRVVLC